MNIGGLATPWTNKVQWTHDLQSTDSFHPGLLQPRDTSKSGYLLLEKPQEEALRPQRESEESNRGSLIAIPAKDPGQWTNPLGILQTSAVQWPEIHQHNKWCYFKPRFQGMGYAIATQDDKALFLQICLYSSHPINVSFCPLICDTPSLAGIILPHLNDLQLSHTICCVQ